MHEDKDLDEFEFQDQKVKSKQSNDQNNSKKWPIVFHPSYNVKCCGLEKLHPFDSSKWGKIIKYLKESSLLNDETIYVPKEMLEEDLLRVHTKEYLNSLKWSFKVASIAEIPLVAFVPNFFVQKYYLKAMRYQVGGSILAGKLAIEKGWAINIGGGFHHCSSNEGGGFCPYADITLLIHNILENEFLVKSVMIVDLDAHQGNGHERDFKGNDKIFIFDVYNAEIYPQDHDAKEAINCRVELKDFTTDCDYLYLVEKHFEESLSKFHPDIIIYNAGTDILEGDSLGKLSISAKGIIRRDKIIFMKARERRIPIVMLTSGGYLKCTAKIIAESIFNLVCSGLISK